MSNPVSGRPMHLLRFFLLCASVVVVLSFLAAMGASRLYWGYFFGRPGLDSRVHQVEEIVSLTALRSEERADGSQSFVANDAYDVAEALTVCRDGRPSVAYYCLGGRILAALDGLGKLPSSPEHMPWEDLSALYQRLEATGLLYQGAAGYDRAKELSGVAVVVEGGQGRRYLIVGVAGGEVSNDHHPYYEFLFELPASGSQPVLLSHNRFFYDVAGLEGMAWWGVWLVLAQLGIVIVVLATVVLGVVRFLAREHPAHVGQAH